MSNIALSNIVSLKHPKLGFKREGVPLKTIWSSRSTGRSTSVTSGKGYTTIICQAESSMAADLKDVAPLEGDVVTIIGQGRIGSALAEMSPYPVKTVLRGEGIDSSSTGPIVICTRNNVLDDIVKATPTSRQSDLVFPQNGMLLPWLSARGLEDNTQALIYFGVAKLGEKPVDGVTEVNPEGLTKVYGKHADSLCSIIKSGGLQCSVVNKDEFLTAMLEKLIWISAIMLVGTEHGVNVGEVDSKHSKEITELMQELGRSGEAALNVSLPDNMVEKLRAYSRAVSSYPCAVKEFEWRNGWFYDLSQKAKSEGKQDPCPMHTDLLKKVGAV